MPSTNDPSKPDSARFIDEAAAAIRSLHDVRPAVEAAVDLLVATLKSGGKVLCAGNGGSAAEAMHLAEELSGRYKRNRRALPGLAICSDGTALTCIANDFGFDQVFARQVEAFGAPGDLLVLFSSSGNSANLVEAVRAAQTRGIKTLALIGRGGGALHGKADVELLVPDTAGAHVQEAHQVVLHLMLESIDATFA